MLLRLRNAQADTRDLGLALDACHERFVSHVALLAQTLPNHCSDAFVDKAPVPAPQRFSRRTKLAQQPVDRQPTRWRRLAGIARCRR